MKKVLMLIALTFGILAFQGNFNTVEAQKRARTTTVIKVRPKARVVKKPHRPSKAHIWIADEWRWNGRTYVVVPGHWRKPNRGMTWTSGHWKQVNGGHVWVAGRWVRR
ncbi:MAG: YXWGXW repeat-containing protein [Saprospiraceae bacterium]